MTKSNWLIILSLTMLSGTLFADEKVDVDAIKEKYWARGNESELGVVQNRQYSKEKKFQLSLIGGISFSDPFLSVKQVGASAGFHLNEYISFHALWWKYIADDSSALKTFKETLGATTNTNIPNWYLGGEVAGSILYGKLSVVGKAIIYYDMHLLGGGGVTQTESGLFGTVSGGIGQQVYLNRWISLSVDYRLQWYREAILEKTIPARMGQLQGYRNNWNNTINLGVNVLWGL